MAITAENFERAKQIHNRLQMKLNSLTEQKGMTPSSPEYIAAADDFNKFDRALSEYTSTQRKVDNKGHLTEDAVTRQPAVVGDPTKSSYFFEPNVTEVQTFFRKNPDALDRLGLRDWSEGVAQDAIRSPVIDGTTGAISGYNVIPARTHLDMLTEEQDPYKAAADEMWRLRAEEAQRKGESVKRYRDVKLNKGEVGDWIRGGVEKGMQRAVAPALMGVADAFTAGQAAPLGDALTDLADYELGRRGYDIEDIFGHQPRSEEVIDRSGAAYLAGNLAGYGAPKNPMNAVSRGITEAALEPTVAAGGRGLYRALRTPVGQLDNYAKAGAGGRAMSSAVSGATGNVMENLHADAARSAAQQGGGSAEEFPGDFLQHYQNAAENVPLNFGVGLAMGGGLDLIGQGIGGTREAFRGLGRNAPLRTLEDAGGGADIARGVSPTEEIRQGYQQARADRLDPKKAPRTVAGQMAEDLAPHIDRSVRQDAREGQERIGRQMEEYYAHPDYNEIRISAKPAVEGLLDMAQRNFRVRGPVDGSVMPMNPAALDEIGGILRDYSQLTSHMDADAPAIAATTGGVVVNGELANRLYGLTPDDPRFIRPGRVAVIRPMEINAESLTLLEGRIDNELQFAANKGAKDDPVWNRFNVSVKNMRDQFPLYRDEAGNLASIPPESGRSEPFAPADDLPPTGGGELSTLPRPRPIGGEPRRPEGLMGIGGPQPALPDTFDPRAPKPQQGPADMLPRAVGVGGEGMVARPEGLYGVGPGGPPIPENPFDPRLPVSRERIEPMMTREVQGDYSQPPPLDPNLRPGIGAPRRFDVYETIEPHPAPEAIQGGEYAEPPIIERAPTTERGTAARSDQLFEGGEFNEKVYQREYGPTEPAPKKITPREDQNISPEEMAMQQHEIDEFLRKDQEMNAPVAKRKEPKKFEFRAGMTLDEYRAMGGETGAKLPPEVQAKIDDGTLTTEAQQKQMYGRGKAAPDDRGGLEKMLDERLDRPSAPELPVSEIEAAALRQAAERSEAGRGWEAKEPEAKAYVDDLFSPNAEARSREMAKFDELSKSPQIIEEAIEAVKKVDKHLGPIPDETKRQMVIQMIEKKLGRKIDAEDLIRFGLISAGLVEMATGDEEGGAGVAAASVLIGRGKKKPTQPEATLDDGRKVRGFSAMRSQQHSEKTAVEKAMKRLGVEGDTTLEGRIRTYGQLDDRGKVDQALLDQATKIGKARDLRNAAGANAYDTLRDRAFGGGNEGIAKALLDFFGFRAYRMAEYPAGRHSANTPRGDDGLSRNPYVSQPSTLLGDMQRELLENPARRLLDLTGGSAAARWGNEAHELLKSNERYEEKRDQQ